MAGGAEADRRGDADAGPYQLAPRADSRWIAGDGHPRHRGRHALQRLPVLVDGRCSWPLPNSSSAGIESLIVIGSVLHVTIVGSFAVAARAAGRGPWHVVYQRLAIGAAAGSVLFTTN